MKFITALIAISSLLKTAAAAQSEGLFKRRVLEKKNRELSGDSGDDAECTYRCCSQFEGKGCVELDYSNCGGDCTTLGKGSCWSAAKGACFSPGIQGYSFGGKGECGENGAATCGLVDECEYRCCSGGSCIDIERENCLSCAQWKGSGVTGKGYCENQAYYECVKGYYGSFKGQGECPSESSEDIGTGFCPDRRERSRLLRNSSYDPTPEEAFQVAKETGGDLDAGFVLEEKLLTPEECALLVAYTDENEGIQYRSNDDDKVIMARVKSPLESIIGEQSTKALYKFFKDYTNNAPITQVWLRKMSGKDTFMGLHTDTMPYQLKIALNKDYKGGDTLIVDSDGAKHISLDAGAGYVHDQRLVHGHMPHTGDKYVLYLVSDPEPLHDLSADVLAL